MFEKPVIRITKNERPRARLLVYGVGMQATIQIEIKDTTARPTRWRNAVSGARQRPGSPVSIVCVTY
jgi:hypothetical protein